MPLVKNQNQSLTYQDAGVSIDQGNLLVERIKPIAARTRRPELLAGIGGFGALFELPLHKYQQPVLVSSTDGVGTKLKLAKSYGKHDTIGIDLVAMCVNDIVVCGAEPVFFLDYFATGKLDVVTATQVIEGIGKGCELAGAALVGGETAEMPGMYDDGDYDLAGFCVGIVEKSAIIDRSKVEVGDVLLGLASSGVHSNGYSLVRKILDVGNIALDTDFEGKKLGEVLLEPTRIYVKSLLKLQQQVEIHALAHITGGGLLENIPRVLPEQVSAMIESTRWVRPPIFQWLQQQGNIAETEMYRTFNCGVGMVVCVAAANADKAVEILQNAGETVWKIGEIQFYQDSSIVIV